MAGAIIYTDGGCIGNPGPGGWGAIVSSGLGKIFELGGKSASTTNNRMEMTAVLEALSALPGGCKDVAVYSDSKYVLQGISDWRFGWQSRGWTNSQGDPVQNKDIWLKLCHLVDRLIGEGVKLHWNYVPGHQGFSGNERVDDIAQGFAKGQPVELYSGDAASYAVDLTPPPANLSKNKRSSLKSGSKKSPIGYCSYVDGAYYMDKTWKQCEARVKGRRGAKYRKVFSLSEADELKVKWGVD